MNKLIVATHGNLSFGLKETYEMIAGEIPTNVFFISLRKDSDLSTFKIEFSQLINLNDNILVLVDLEGGSPYNVACEYLYSEKFKGKIEIIAGINFPMLVQAIEELSECDLKELSTEVIIEGKKAIKKAIKLKEIENNDDF